MPKVFVHGNPECDAVWELLVDALADRGVTDVVRLSPPGFGAPCPAGFDATATGYHRWLVDELTALDGPIDLVGHDWGAAHVAAIAADRPDLISTLTMDCGGLLHRDYEWHDMAQAWQTPGVGEEVIAAMIGTPHPEKVAMYVSFGMPAAIADAHATALDETMGACILTLYRSAPKPVMEDLGARIRAATRVPTHFVVAEEDHYVAAELAMETAADLDAHVTRLAGQSHWWMLTAPLEAADAMVSFWAGTERR
ncbi:MAG: alpha/beta hydrolase [Actinomycetota bacterium]